MAGQDIFKMVTSALKDEMSHCQYLLDTIKEKGDDLPKYEKAFIRRILTSRAEEEFDFILVRYVREGNLDIDTLKDLLPEF